MELSDPLTACWQPALAASADALGYSWSLDATYYSIDALAAGQCGAATQAYTLFVDRKCGPSGTVITRSRVVHVARAAGLRVDIGF